MENESECRMSDCSSERVINKTSMTNGDWNQITKDDPMTLHKRMSHKFEKLTL